MKLFSIGVHSSVGMKKDAYYFLYKDSEFKYAPGHKKRDTDCLTGKFQDSLANDSCYSLMTEFLSAFAFGCDAQVIPEPGVTTRFNRSLAEYTGGFAARRRIPIEETLDEFWYVPPIRTSEQATLVRLYREARSSDSIYLSVLFYWHCIVFPQKSEGPAIAYFDRLWKNLPSDLHFLSDSIDRVLKNPLFTTSAPTSLGNYIREGIRNSIAHIVRDRPTSRNLGLDLLSELRHLYDVNLIMRHFSRYRLESDFGLNEPHDEKLFCYFDPK